MPNTGFTRFIMTLIVLTLCSVGAKAQDKLALALGQRGNWDTAIAELGQEAGIFKKHGLTLDILWTQGAGESQQALLSGSADIGLLGTQSAFAVYAKGAPLRIVSAEATGAADYWYVRADSPIKSFKDTPGKTVAFSTIGASTNTMALAFLKEAGVKAELVATGGPSATLTQVMSGQIDVGWSAPPFGLTQIGNNEILPMARTCSRCAGRRSASWGHSRTNWTRDRRSSLVSCKPIGKPSTGCMRTTMRSNPTPLSPEFLWRWRSRCGTSSFPRTFYSRKRSWASML
jgi:hypothetical protein